MDSVARDFTVIAVIARSAVDPLMRFEGTCLLERKSLMPCSSMRPLSLVWAPSNAMTEWLFVVGNPLDDVVAEAAAAAVWLAVGWQIESILIKQIHGNLSLRQHQALMMSSIISQIKTPINNPAYEAVGR